MRFSANTLQVVVLSVCLSVVEIPCATAGQEKAAAKPSFNTLQTKVKKEQVIARLEQRIPS